MTQSSTVEQIDARQAFVNSEPSHDTFAAQRTHRLVRPSYNIGI